MLIGPHSRLHLALPKKAFPLPPASSHPNFLLGLHSLKFPPISPAHPGLIELYFWITNSISIEVSWQCRVTTQRRKITVRGTSGIKTYGTGATLGSEGHVNDHMLIPGSVSPLPLSQRWQGLLCWLLHLTHGHEALPLPHWVRFVSTLALSFIMFHWII